MRTRAFRRLSATAVALAMLTSIAYGVLRESTASASHGAPILDISETGEGAVPRTIGPGEVDLQPNLAQGAATKPTLILAEIEGGANDPEQTLGDENANSYNKPDGSCTVPKDDTICSLVLNFPVPTGAGRVTIRLWVNGHRIDTLEGAQEKPNAGVGGAAGCVGEGDRTEVLQFIVSGSSGTPPDTRPPAVPGALASPPVCPEDTSQTFAPGDDEAGGGGSTPTPTPTPTPTATGSGTPTPTDTGTPTPTDTGTPTPTDTGTPTPTNTGSPSPTGPSGEIRLAVSPSRGVWGTDFVISGDVLCAGVAVPNSRVTVYRRYAGSAQTSSIETASDVQGVFAIRDTDLARSADYSASWSGEGSACPSGAKSGPGQRRATVFVGIGAAATDPTLARGQRARFTGKVLPGHAGKKAILQVYRGRQGRWDYASEVRLDRNSWYQLYYAYRSKGYLLFRIVFPTQDPDHGWNISKILRVDWS